MYTYILHYTSAESKYFYIPAPGQHYFNGLSKLQSTCRIRAQRALATGPTVSYALRTRICHMIGNGGGARRM